MNRTRLAVAAGVAALTLGATAAVAQTQGTQEVTITVAAAARSITAAGTVELSALLNATGVSDSDTSSVTYTNPAGNESAKITVSRDATDLGELTLSVVAAGDEEEGEGAAAAAATFATTVGTGGNFITGISADKSVTSRGVTFTLGGDAPSEAGTIVTDFTFTITDN